jgi:hypothetical protein
LDIGALQLMAEEKRMTSTFVCPLSLSLSLSLTNESLANMPAIATFLHLLLSSFHTRTPLFAIALLVSSCKAARCMYVLVTKEPKPCNLFVDAAGLVLLLVCVRWACVDVIPDRLMTSLQHGLLVRHRHLVCMRLSLANCHLESIPCGNARIKLQGSSIFTIV